MLIGKTVPKTGGLGRDYFAACTYQGRPLPWRVVGVLHARIDAADDWPAARAGLEQRAQGLACPAIAERTFPPTWGDTGAAVGALCVDPSVEAEVRGAAQ